MTGQRQGRARQQGAPAAGRPGDAVQQARAEAIARQAENVARLVCDLADLVYRHADTIAGWTTRNR